jgi:molybdopterin molybdotransferase
MRSIAEALASMLPAFSPLGEEEVHLTESAGRYVSRDVTARFDAPPFDNSAMDGFAVRASDVASAAPDTPVRLPVRGESRCSQARTSSACTSSSGPKWRSYRRATSFDSSATTSNPA